MYRGQKWENSHRCSDVMKVQSVDASCESKAASEANPQCGGGQWAASASKGAIFIGGKLASPLLPVPLTTNDRKGVCKHPPLGEQVDTFMKVFSFANLSVFFAMRRLVLDGDPSPNPGSL